MHGGRAVRAPFFYIEHRKTKSNRRNLSRGFEGIETRLVGRKNELEKMLDALETVFEDREMQAVSIIGEAGLGKSRLLFEFRDCIELMSQKVRVFNARATETMRGLPFSLVRDLFSFRFEILDDDSPQIARDKLVAGFLNLISNLKSQISNFRFQTSDAEMKIHFIGQLIGFDFSNSPHVKGILDDLQQIQTRALLYAAQFFSAISAEIPTVFYLDDLHWADKKSLELSQKAEDKGVIADVWRIFGLISGNLGQDLTINEESKTAAECFEKSLQIFAETKIEANTARTLRDFARYENKRGNSEKARKMLDEAREIFTRLEMPLEIERCSGVWKT